jgi:hypothetical protein
MNPLLDITRRDFLKAGLGTAVVSASLSGPRLRAADAAVTSLATSANPWKERARFKVPRALARRITAVGNRLYVTCAEHLVVLGTRGELILETGLQAVPRCCAVAADGTIYVGLKDRVVVLDQAGKQTAQWEPGPERTWLSALAAGENEVYAADSGNRVILRYDRSGKLLGRIGKKDAERNVPGLVVPSPYLDVDLGRDGLLRVNNPGRHRVELYTTGGDLELAWGSPLGGVAGFCGCCNPISLATLPDGRVVTCEKGISRVKVYSAEGRLEAVAAGPEIFPENNRAGRTGDRPDGLLGGLDAATDSQGNIHVLDLVTGEIRTLTATT